MSVLAPELRAQAKRLVPSTLKPGQMVSIVCLLMVVGQLSFRAWAAYGGWFYVDDFKFLATSREPLTLDLLLTPHDDKLMPSGLLIAWLVAQGGAFPWPAAATSLVLMQAVASLAAWLMLRTVFGSRWGIVPLLALYLFLPMTLTAFMWWGAAINLVPIQAAMFLAVAAHVTYLRTRRFRWILTTALVIAVGMTFFQKSLLIYPVILLLSYFWFARGNAPRRVWDALRRWWPAWTVHGLVLGGYLGYHLTHIDSPVSVDSTVDYGGVLSGVAFQTFLTTAVGGPVRWSEAVLPAAQVDPPVAVLAAAALLAGGTIAYAAMRRTFTWPAWGLIVGYVLIDGFLLASGRGSTAGVLASVEARYVSDAAPVLVLALGLAFMPLRASGTTSSMPRQSPILTSTPPTWSFAAIGALVAAGSAVSSVQYVSFWHDDFAARVFVDNVTAAERRTGDLRILDAEVPAAVILPGLYPYTLPSRFFADNTNVHPVKRGTNLAVLDDQGVARIPVIDGGVRAAPPPAGSCGRLYSTDPKQKEFARPNGLTLQMSGRGFGFGTWVSIGYLATKDSEVTVTAGDASRRIPLVRGANTYFMRPGKDVDEVSFNDLAKNTTLCVSSVQIGTLSASEFS